MTAAKVAGRGGVKANLKLTGSGRAARCGSRAWRSRIKLGRGGARASAKIMRLQHQRAASAGRLVIRHHRGGSWRGISWRGAYLAADAHSPPLHTRCLLSACALPASPRTHRALARTPGGGGRRSEINRGEGRRRREIVTAEERRGGEACGVIESGDETATMKWRRAWRSMAKISAWQSISGEYQ